MMVHIIQSAIIAKCSAAFRVPICEILGPYFSPCRYWIVVVGALWVEGPQNKKNNLLPCEQLTIFFMQAMCCKARIMESFGSCNSNVNVNPVCPIGQPVSGTGGKLWNYFLYTSTLAKFQKVREVWTPTFDINCKNLPWRQILPAATICNQSIRAIFWAATACVPLWLPS